MNYSGRCDAEENFISESNSSDMRIPPPTSMSMLTSSSTFTNNNSKDNPEPRAKKVRNNNKDSDYHWFWGSACITINQVFWFLEKKDMPHGIHS